MKAIHFDASRPVSGALFVDRKQELRRLGVAVQKLKSGRTDFLAVLGLRKQGKYAEAEVLLEHALRLKKKTLGTEHPSLAASLTNLARLAYKQSTFTKSEQLFREAIALDEKTLGPHHANVADDLTGLAELYQKQRRFTEAEALLIIP